MHVYLYLYLYKCVSNYNLSPFKEELHILASVVDGIDDDDDMFGLIEKVMIIAKAGVGGSPIPRGSVRVLVFEMLI